MYQVYHTWYYMIFWMLRHISTEEVINAIQYTIHVIQYGNISIILRSIYYLVYVFHFQRYAPSTHNNIKTSLTTAAPTTHINT